MSTRSVTPVGSVVTWGNPPPLSRRGRAHRMDHAAIATELRGRPGEWGLLPTATTGMAGQIQRGDISVYRPAGSFEAVRRDGPDGIKVWARYVGEEVSSCSA